jgi:UDP-N-acetylmuramate dehydrogenase
MNWYRGFERTVRENAPLAHMNTYRVGGPAQYFAEPTDPLLLGQLLTRAITSGLRTRFLGHGTNLLVADAGVRGLVVKLPKLSFGYLYRRGTRVRVGAAHSLPALVKWSAANGLSGLECLQGVPGTVGAALRMNAGGKYGEIHSCVRRVMGFERDGGAFDLSAEECGFTYRDSALHGRIIVGCELTLSEGDPIQIQQRTAQIMREKCATQPLQSRSAGCVFKNPGLPGIPPAGKMIDELGLKGLRVGGASVSPLHANFLVCTGGAVAADLARLICMIRERVFQQHGIQLETEVEVWGMDRDELIPDVWGKSKPAEHRAAIA